jgi:hypothetical protein
MEGPRGVRREDIASLRALTNLVMREGLVDQYPQLFNAPLPTLWYGINYV